MRLRRREIAKDKFCSRRLKTQDKQDFGNEIMKSIIPALLNNDADGILWKGTETTLEGTLTPHFEYLADYVATAR